MGVQGSLFGHESPTFDPRFDRLVRVRLSDDAWLDHAPQFLTGHERLMAELGFQVRWRRDHLSVEGRDVLLPRLVARLPDDGPEPAILTDLRERLSARYQVNLSETSLSLYRDGRDGVTWHGDRGARERRSSVMATLSLGGPRPFQLRPQDKALQTQAAPISFQLGWGDLLIMGGSAQRTWEHRVPKRKHADPRLVIMFRESYDA